MGNLSPVIQSLAFVVDLKIVITEGLNFVIVGATPLNVMQINNADKHQYLNYLISEIVRTDTIDHKWQFDIPSDLNVLWNKRLITNKNASPIRELESRDDRADLFIWDETVYLIFYKKIAQLEDFLPADQWFSPEARTAFFKQKGP